ncbi:MAG: DegT/DnrJ/EryC1/StrS family aminotransferase [Candidatus Cyclobacteriaceae bacterium M2_1C_046]
MKIEMVDLRTQYDKIKKEINAAITNVIENTAFIKGPDVKQFAENFTHYNNVNHVIPCGNGTDALQIAMMALNLEPGDEVILPVHTYVATAEVIALLKLKPVFVDVDPDNFNILPGQVEEAITTRTKAIVPVHLYGQCAPMKELLQIAEKYDLYVIEDAAQAVGAEYVLDGKTKKAGTIGTIGATSFFPSKNLGCYGDGGALMTDNTALAERCEMIANHGQKVKYHHDDIGVNSRLDTIQAAVLNVKLKYLDNYAESRRQAAAFYDKSLNNITSIILPKQEKYSTHVYHQYTLKVEDGSRDKLKEFLSEKGIPSMIYYPVPLHLQKAYSSYGYKKGDFPVAEELSKKVLSLPIHTEMNNEQLEYITSTIKAFYNE